ncbi:hypothetical protein GCM10027294_22220 [Marinactinospora endophytica]
MTTTIPGRADDWRLEYPRLDRAAGALAGAAMAACLARLPDSEIGALERPDADGTGSSYLAWLVMTALRHLDDPRAVAEAVDTEAELAWALALCRAVEEGVLIPAASTSAYGPISAAWRAVTTTPVPRLDPARRTFPCRHLVDAIRSARASGGPEAALYAGALAGARWGVSAVPLEIQRRLADILPLRRLVTGAAVALRGSRPDTWPEVDCASSLPFNRYAPFQVPHPHDPGVILCNLPYVPTAADAQAVVSLCQVGAGDMPAHLPARDTVEVWLADTTGINSNLHFVLDQAARAVATLRAEGKRVLLHCAACQSRTPAVAAHYAVLARGVEVVTALREAIRAVGGHLNNAELARTVAVLNGVELTDPAAVLFPEGMPEVTRHRLG